MSSPKAIIDIMVDGARIFGKALAAAGRQAVRNAKYKPEGSPSSAPVGTGSSKNRLTNELQMTIEEARLILNVKKDDPMETIQRNYDHIFAANSPPPPPVAAKPGQPAPTSAVKAGAKASKAFTHSHYLQSKVYRALERIKAEQIMEGGGGAAAAEAEAGTRVGVGAGAGSASSDTGPAEGGQAR